LPPHARRRIEGKAHSGKARIADRRVDGRADVLFADGRADAKHDADVGMERLDNAVGGNVLAAAEAMAKHIYLDRPRAAKMAGRADRGESLALAAVLTPEPMIHFVEHLARRHAVGLGSGVAVNALEEWVDHRVGRIAAALAFIRAGAGDAGIFQRLLH